MYYMAQNTSEQIRLTDDNIKRLVELRNITQAFYDNQMSLEVDLKRVNLNIENLTVQRDNAIAMLEQQYTMLKYVINLSCREGDEGDCRKSGKDRDGEG